MVALRLPWTFSLALSPRTFTLNGVQFERTLVSYGRCLYAGTLSGTYVPGPATTLTITSAALSLVGGSTGSCSTRPTLVGTISTNLATV